MALCMTKKYNFCPGQSNNIFAFDFHLIVVENFVYNIIVVIYPLAIYKYDLDQITIKDKEMNEIIIVFFSSLF